MAEVPPVVPPTFTAEQFENEVDYCKSHLADHERSDPFRLAAMLRQAAAQARELEQVTRERDAWLSTAMQVSRDTEFYRGLVQQAGEVFGVEAKTSDDGSIQEDVLVVKVPELVQRQARELETAQKELAKTRRPLQHELLDLLTLMPETQLTEIVDYIATLRSARSLSAAHAPKEPR